MRRVVFWGIVAATVAVYGAMVLWSLPRVAAAAGGLPPFDMRPLGYSEAEARAFLTAITPEGRAFYSGVQHRLDLAYPALLALTLVLSFARLIPGRGLRLALSALALAGMAADWGENLLVGRLLALPATEVPAALIAQANFCTLVKGGCTTLALTALLAAGLWRLWRRI